MALEVYERSGAPAPILGSWTLAISLASVPRSRRPLPRQEPRSAMRIDDEFREIARHARDMHDLLVEEIEAQQSNVNAEVRKLSDRTLVDVLQLEALSGPQRGPMI